MLSVPLYDVCAVFPVHGSASGGVLSLPFVSVGGFSIDLLVAQVVGVAFIALWTVAATGVVFGAFEAVDQARVSSEHERDGPDAAAYGVDTDPEFGEPNLAAESGGTAAEGGVRADGGTTDGIEIELVMAFIRPERLAAVKTALARVGAPSLTVTNVSGRGSQPAKTGRWRGEEYTVDLHQKVKVEWVVADVPADEVAGAIREAAGTGEPGDGKVFVLPVEDAVQIRTGAVGVEAV